MIRSVIGFGSSLENSATDPAKKPEIRYTQLCKIEKIIHIAAPEVWQITSLTCNFKSADMEVTEIQYFWKKSRDFFCCRVTVVGFFLGYGFINPWLSLLEKLISCRRSRWRQRCSCPSSIWRFHHRARGRHSDIRLWTHKIINFNNLVV